MAYVFLITTFEDHISSSDTLHVDITLNVVHAQRAIVYVVIYILNYTQDEE